MHNAEMRLNRNKVLLAATNRIGSESAETNGSSRVCLFEDSFFTINQVNIVHILDSPTSHFMIGILRS